MDKQIMKSHFSFLSTMRQMIQDIKMYLVLLTTLVFSSATLAIDIADEPLFLANAAPPNIMFVLDDSGSMDWDILTVPHWRAQNYDHDVMRYWARGGWLGWDETPKSSKVTDGSWVSYTGYCNDRNADGICYNESYLNDDNDRSDSEKAIITSEVASTRSYRLRLYHVYHWNWTGKCVAPSTPSGGGANATDYLPSLGDVLAFVTGIGQAQAHDYTGYRWNRTTIDNDAQPLAIIPKPNKQNTDTATYGTREDWKKDGSDTFIPAAGDAADKISCEAQGPGYTWDVDGKRQMIHTGATDWSAAGSLTVDTTVEPHTYTYKDSFGVTKYSGLTGNKWIYVADNSTLGDYHWEYIEKTGHDVLPPVVGLDINGDGDGSDTSFKEKDSQSSRVVNYRYLQHLTDNTYPRTDWRACGETSSLNTNTTVFYTAANRCPRPNDQMPGNYVVKSPNVPINNPSSKVADSNTNIGKLDFIQLGNPAIVPRYIRSDTWVGGIGSPRRTPNVDVTMPPWAADTKHGMSKHDAFPLLVDWRPRSADFNVMYYNPKNKYSIWPNITEVLPGGCIDKFNCARSNPQSGTTGYGLTVDLARPRTEYGAVGAGVVSVEAGFVYEIWVDDAGYFGNKPEWQRGNSKCGNSTNGVYTLPQDVDDPATGNTISASGKVCFTYLDEPNGEVDLWDSHYRIEVKNSEIVVQKVRRTPHLKGEALYTNTVYDRSSHYYWDNDDRAGASGNGSVIFTGAELSNMRVAMSDTRVLSTTTYDPADYATFSASALCLKVLGEDPDNIGHCRTLAQVQENAANWYQYNRKRSFVAKGAIAELMAKIPDINYGLMGIKKSGSGNISSLFNDVYDGNGSGNGDTDRTTHNDSIRSELYSYPWPATGTPLRQALQRAGEYFAGNGPTVSGVDHGTSPITESCQKNFAIMLTDGYWSGLDPDSVGNTDNDPYSNTLADVAKKYYDEDLSPLDNKVPVDSFDTNNKQHLTTIGVGFGVTGSLTDDSGDGWPGSADASGALPYTESTSWRATPGSSDQYKIDDLWHAAYNSRGLYLNAKDPAELISKLNDAIRFATAKIGSASGVTLNEITKSSSTRVYQTLFNSDKWSGDVISYSLDSTNGLVWEWSAQSQLDAASVTYDTRNIFTFNDASSAGVSFRWGSLSASQQGDLRIQWPSILSVASTTSNDEFGEAQLNFIRGKMDDVRFRSRTHKLGDIVHSSPVYVGAPNAGYDEASFPGYHAFQTATANSNRKMIFAGANDGMLHAFDATTGDEEYAYIPSILIPKLNALAHKVTATQDFVHRFLVDATPVVNDVFFAGDSAWHTVLVGGLGAGGKGIYALDITTTPSNELSPESTVLWEFTDADMNYSYSQPVITKLANGEWAAIFGNGYAKNGEGNGKSVLYIVNIETGALIKKIVASDVGSEDNGLSTPTVVDRDNDFIADNVYAGDLQGNLWRFDISESNPVSKWKVSFGGNPLFRANDGGSPSKPQPITQKIEVVKHPSGLAAGIMLHVGTGQYFGTADIVAPYTTQSMYSIWDYYEKEDSTNSHGDFDRDDLLQQKILAELTHGSGELVRVTSSSGVKDSEDSTVYRNIEWLSSGQVGDSGWRSNVRDKGWFMDLVNTGVTPLDNKGERIITKAIVRAGAVHINTMVPAEDACVGGGTGWPMVLDASSGARFSTSVLDVNQNGTFGSDDYVSYTWVDGAGNSHTELVPVSGVKRDGIMTDSTLLNLGGGRSLNLTDMSTATVEEHEILVPSPGVRDSWTQLD